MGRDRNAEAGATGTAAERTSDRDFVVTRTIHGPADLVFAAWTDTGAFRRWWAPASCGLTIIACDLDVRTGGTYRLEIGHPSSARPMVFHGRYLDVVPDRRIVWTNDEAGEGGPVTTVTFEPRGEHTLVAVHERYPSADTLDEAIASGSTSGWGEQFAQLDAMLAAPAER